MSLPQIVRAASAGSISWLQAAGYQAFKGKGLPLAMALLPSMRGSRRVSCDFGPWPRAPQAQTTARRPTRRGWRASRSHIGGTVAPRAPSCLRRAGPSHAFGYALALGEIDGIVAFRAVPEAADAE